jgi:O-antigen/teichoic acid export membrane protein
MGVSNISLPRLRANILALSVVQAGNYLVPLLALPYLARVLGSHAYGEVVFVQAAMMFGMLLVDFGFSWSATRDISATRDDRAKVSALFAGIWGLQWLLLTVMVFIVILAVWYLPALRPHASLYATGLGIVLGQVLFPLWLFQGLEALKVAAAIQVVGKLLALPCLLIWVHGPQDQVAAIAFFSASSVLSGLGAMWWIYRSRWVEWFWPSRADLAQAFRQGAWIFGSRVSISLYTTAVPLAVGLWAGPAQLAAFNLADKVRVLIQAFLAPVAQALFPRMSYLIMKDRVAAFALLAKSAWLVGIVSLLSGGLVWLYADEIMFLLGGTDFVNTGDILRWLAFVPLMVAGSNTLGVQVMLPRGMNRAFTTILTAASIMSLLGLYPAVMNAGARGAAQLVLLVECMVTLFMALYLQRETHNWRGK